jgi:hypothetical protein
VKNILLWAGLIRCGGIKKFVYELRKASTHKWIMSEGFDGVIA